MVQTFRPTPIVQVVKFILIAIFVSLILLFLRDYIPTIFPPLILALWLITLFYILVAYIRTKTRSIVLDEESITYTSGLFTVHKVILHYFKITEVTYTQDIVQRLFGIGTINMDTAGGNTIAIHVVDLRINDIKKTIQQINEKGDKKQ
ncbi:Bacterial PH domain protein [Candidatus Bilamarchaeum dharawalense]|uniref:Bacterial PH domain protein n=1 Tax=Candidatus Bilamarchaeum dharawalense TaxID=2885759 RepID=A0A5E4LYK7_9ARCH|nr:Bacterial PH domain protein [Candidatus Bilamarchaeum dharawalense]